MSYCSNISAGHYLILKDTFTNLHISQFTCHVEKYSVSLEKFPKV